MPNSSKQILWLDLTHGTYFLIPDNTEWVSGDVTLRKLMGGSQQADKEWLAQWQVEQAVAEKYIQQATGHYLASLQEKFTDFVRKWFPSQTSNFL